MLYSFTSNQYTAKTRRKRKRKLSLERHENMYKCKHKYDALYENPQLLPSMATASPAPSLTMTTFLRQFLASICTKSEALEFDW